MRVFSQYIDATKYKRIGDEEVEGVHELFILCKGCKLKNVPTGQTTAAYISERTRNS